MEDRHWTDDALIDRLYGLGEEDVHLEGCADCRRRWEQILASRQEILEPPRVPEALLAAQRRSIYARLQAGVASSPAFRLAYAAALTCVLIVAVVLARPTPRPAPSVAASDTQVFQEAFCLAASPEPRAVIPIRGLFEVQ